MHPCILLFFSFVEYIGRRLAKLLQSQIRMIVYPEEYLPVTVQTGTIGQERNNDYKNPNHHTLLKQSPYVFKLLCILLPALQRGSCALIKLTSKYPCRYLQNTQNPLKSGWDGNLLCMYTAVLVNSLFRLQPRLALRPPAAHLRRAAESQRSLFNFFDTRKPPVIEPVLRGISSWWSTAVWAVWCCKHLWG